MDKRTQQQKSHNATTLALRCWFQVRLAVSMCTVGVSVQVTVKYQTGTSGWSQKKYSTMSLKLEAEVKLSDIVNSKRYSVKKHAAIVLVHLV